MGSLPDHALQSRSNLRQVGLSSLSNRRSPHQPPPRIAGFSVTFSTSDSDLDDVPILKTSINNSSQVLQLTEDSESDSSAAISVTQNSLSKPPEVSEATPLPLITEAQELVPATIAPSDEFRTFTVAWKKKGFGKKDIRLCMNDRIIFTAKHTKLKNIGNCVVFSEGSAVCGRLIHDPNSSGFLFEVPEEETPLFAIRFHTIVDNKSYVKGIRIVFPKVRPYRPTEKRMELGQIAKTGVVDSDQFEVYNSKIPSREKNGRLVLSFGPHIYVVASVKNFIIDDENGETVFMIMKSSSSTCSIRLKEPITALIGFVIAVAAL
jgi:hypothetical protein